MRTSDFRRHPPRRRIAARQDSSRPLTPRALSIEQRTHSEKVAAVEVSPQQPLGLDGDLINRSRFVSAGDTEPLIMAAAPHSTTDKKRVKVYELKNNDWFDRGTGFCLAAFVPSDEGQGKEPRVFVESEEQPDRLLLETKIIKEDGFQRQGDTLIVWTEQGSGPDNGVDMALSFQEAEGCTLIWKFIDTVQHTFGNPLGGPDDGLSDDLAMDAPPPVQLPPPELGSLSDLENSVRAMSTSPAGRDALAKAIMTEDYISRLIPLVEIAEDLENIQDLHRLCNIMKSILLLNDTAIIEHAVSDECVMGVVGALEYDPDFPNHKANHRQWLTTQARFKQVVKIEDDTIRRKIHQTHRLQYLKDVVLARILDDPTFSVLNSLIFFNHVDMVTHLQQNSPFLAELFGIFADPKEDQLRKKDGVLFIQQCCAIAKNIHPPNRQNLYNNFLAHGLLLVINFGLRNIDVSIRVGATDILVSMIDHDPQMIRHTIYRQIQEKQAPLTDTLIDLLLVEVDLGIKSQISDALKVLLDPNPPPGPPEARADFVVGQARVRPQPTIDPQQEIFLDNFYQQSAVRLFRPLLELEKRPNMDFDVMHDGIFSYLNDILCFYIQRHLHRSKFFVLQHNLAQRFIQLLSAKEMHLQLVAIRFFKHLVQIKDEFYIKHIAEKQILGPVLDLLLKTMPRDNLVCSACLDLFGHIISEAGIKDLIKHLVENYREKIMALSYIDTFRNILAKYDQSSGYTTNGGDPYFMESEDEVTGRRALNAGRGLMGEHLAVDPAQEEYWNCSDDEDEVAPSKGAEHPSTNGTPSKLLVEYSSDEEAEENGDTLMVSLPLTSQEDRQNENEIPATSKFSGKGATPPPPERVAEKRRREQEDEDEMDKLLQHKRRNSSSASLNSLGSTASALRKKKGLAGSRDASPNGPKRIAISISSSLKGVGGKSPPQTD